MSASLAYFDSYRTARLPQNLTQAQRDAFGAHTYERTDKPAAASCTRSGSRGSLTRLEHPHQVIERGQQDDARPPPERAPATAAPLAGAAALRRVRSGAIR